VNVYQILIIFSVRFCKWLKAVEVGVEEGEVEGEEVEVSGKEVDMDGKDEEACREEGGLV
jgi:hypothetical protein